MVLDPQPDPVIAAAAGGVKVSCSQQRLKAKLAQGSCGGGQCPLLRSRASLELLEHNHRGPLLCGLQLLANHHQNSP